CAHWLALQPEGAIAIRAGAELVGFFSLIALERTSAGERRRDPAAEAVWRHVLRGGPSARRRPISLNRYWLARDSYQDISPVQGVCTALMAHHHVATPRIAHSFGVFARPDEYAPLLAFTG